MLAAIRTHLVSLSGNARGVASMSAAMAVFIMNDALVKQVSTELPAAQLIVVRGLMAHDGKNQSERHQSSNHD